MRGKRRWRQPTVIWLRALRSNRSRRSMRTKRVAVWADIKKSFRARRSFGRVRRVPWTSLTLYGGTLLLAGLVLYGVPARTGPIPVTAPVAHSPHRSFLDKTVQRFSASRQSVQSWLDQGVPLMGLAQHPRELTLHAGALLMTALADITGVRLTSLGGILRMEIPTLAMVRPTTAVVAKPAPRPPQQTVRIPGLPGDGGRVWAELGKNPLVGIYQTHSHESFWPSLPSGSATAYSTDWSQTIVQVGWWLAQDLNNQGIGVVQSRVDNMSEGILASYNKSYYTAKQLLKWYPTVRCLIDLHRSQSPASQTTAVVHGVKMAKILIVVGTNKLLPNPYWHQNLLFAVHLAQALKNISPSLVIGKGIDMVPYRYNQQLMPQDLLIEVGGPHNTLAEERYAVHELAMALHHVLQGSAGSHP